MARFRCLTCSKIIECDPYDPSVLINHIKTDHPEIELPYNEQMENLESEMKPLEDKKPYQEESNVKKEDKDGPDPDINIHMEETVVESPELKPIYTRKYKVKTPLTPRSPQKRRMYRTSIEKWRPAKGLIYCPKCGATKKPIIKSKSEKMSYTSAGAACILTCWPLCFLPCLFQAPTKDYLHCAECHNFLGMYDSQRNCVRPNREFVEGGGCEKQKVDCKRQSTELKMMKEEGKSN